MSNRWQVKNPLNLHERKIIEYLLEKGISFKEIANELGRSKSCILREVKRFKSSDLYNAKEAQHIFEQVQILKRIACTKKKVICPHCQKIVPFPENSPLMQLDE